jgi:hypothetical protein
VDRRAETERRRRFFGVGISPGDAFESSIGLSLDNLALGMGIALANRENDG